MNKPIATYNDLLAEKARLKQLLKVQRAQVEEDIREIKEDLKPFTGFVSTVAMFVSPTNKKGLAGMGINMAVDLVFKKLLLSKSNWVSRMVIPFLVKNYASHIAEKPGRFLEKLKKVFAKKAHAGMEAV